MSRIGEIWFEDIKEDLRLIVFGNYKENNQDISNRNLEGFCCSYGVPIYTQFEEQIKNFMCKFNTKPKTFYEQALNKKIVNNLNHWNHKYEPCKKIINLNENDPDYIIGFYVDKGMLIFITKYLSIIYVYPNSEHYELNIFEEYLKHNRYERDNKRPNGNNNLFIFNSNSKFNLEYIIEHNIKLIPFVKHKLFVELSFSFGLLTITNQCSIFITYCLMEFDNWLVNDQLNSEKLDQKIEELTNKMNLNIENKIQELTQKITEPTQKLTEENNELKLKIKELESNLEIQQTHNKTLNNEIQDIKNKMAKTDENNSYNLLLKLKNKLI